MLSLARRRGRFASAGALAGIDAAAFHRALGTGWLRHGADREQERCGGYETGTLGHGQLLAGRSAGDGSTIWGGCEVSAWRRNVIVRSPGCETPGRQRGFADSEFGNIAGQSFAQRQGCRQATGRGGGLDAIAALACQPKEPLDRIVVADDQVLVGNEA